MGGIVEKEIKKVIKRPLNKLNTYAISTILFSPLKINVFLSIHNRLLPFLDAGEFLFALEEEPLLLEFLAHYLWTQSSDCLSYLGFEQVALLLQQRGLYGHMCGWTYVLAG